MAYDRYDTRDAPRDERSRWSDDRHDRDWDRDSRSGSGRRDERGFFERAGDEIASWFGDDDAERRRHQDEMRDQRGGGWSSRNRESGRGWGGDRMSGGSHGDPDWNRGRDSDWNRDRGSSMTGMSGGDRDWGRDRSSGMSSGEDFGRDRHRDRDRDWNENRGLFARGGSSERDYNPSWRRELSGGDRDRSRERGRDFGGGRDQGYRPMTGDYGRGTDYESEQFFAASGYGRGERGFGDYGRERDRSDRDRSQSEWGRDPYRSTSRAGSSDQSDRSRHEDPHYHSWRQRHMSDLDRDYDDYRRENQSRFADDFAGWRERRQQKRGLLGQIREHMEVVGKDDEHVGKVDRVAGDRVILSKSDAESGGAHHSLSCSDIDRIEGDRVILDCSADEARNRWRDESRNRALFERDDQGEMGPRGLDRSFSGTYR
jgi:hypothetical protein